jgi:lactoylglutathione lyase
MAATHFWHSMLRISDPEQTLKFFELLGLKEVERYENTEGRFTLYFLAIPGDEKVAQIELTHNWDESGYGSGRNFGHLCFYVDNIYDTCRHLAAAGVVINRPPRDGHMAFIKTPDQISIELIQAERKRLPPQEPWLSMPNVGSW